jgi:hypothetical protein
MGINRGAKTSICNVEKYLTTIDYILQDKYALSATISVFSGKKVSKNRYKYNFIL